MTIHEAAKKAGLTKKAIRYYEEKKLIYPKTDGKTNYKNYTTEDIEKLSQIAFLRNLDMPVSSIRLYLKVDEDAKQAILKSHLEKINKDIAALKKISSLLKEQLAKKTETSAGDNHFSILPENQKTFSLNRISKLFPTPLGKYILIHFGPYLDEPADTREKNDALNNMISFLDDLPEEDIKDDLLKYFEEIDDFELNEIFKEIDGQITSAVMDSKISDEEIMKAVEVRNGLYKNDMIYKISTRIREHLEQNGFYDNFIGNLKIISTKYNKFSANIAKLNSSLRLEYDSEGMVVRK